MLFRLCFRVRVPPARVLIQWRTNWRGTNAGAILPRQKDLAVQFSGGYGISFPLAESVATIPLVTPWLVLNIALKVAGTWRS